MTTSEIAVSTIPSRLSRASVPPPEKSATSVNDDVRGEPEEEPSRDAPGSPLQDLGSFFVGPRADVATSSRRRAA